MAISPPAIPWVQPDQALPEARFAMREPRSFKGLVAAGRDLSAARLVEAYQQGLFPWFSLGQPVLWWSPDPRMVLQVQDYRWHDSLRKAVRRFRRRPDCELRFDTAFDQVIRHCATRPRAGQSGTWIVPEMMEAYEALHAMGLAHSVETWDAGKLVGGLYVVSIGTALFGESMFALQSDASKIALSGLIGFALAHDMPWIDCQQNTAHLAFMGAREQSRDAFVEAVRRETQRPAPAWRFESIYWDALDSLGSRTP